MRKIDGQDSMTFYDAERLYSEIMSGVFEVLTALNVETSDPRVSEIIKSIDLTARDIHSYATSPPSL